MPEKERQQLFYSKQNKIFTKQRIELKDAEKNNKYLVEHDKEKLKVMANKNNQ